MAEKKISKIPNSKYLATSRINAYVGIEIKKALASKAKAKRVNLSRYITEVLRDHCFGG